MKMSLTIKKCPAKLGSSINVRNELHGDEDVGACDFKLSGIMLEKDDLNELYDDKYFHNSVFNTKGRLFEPMTRYNDPMSFKLKFEKSTVTLWLGLSDEIVKFSECKLRKITLDPQTGGLTELCLQVQCNPDVPQIGHLYLHQNKDVSCSIRFGKEEKPKNKAQPELPLGSTEKDEDGNDLPAMH
jgi:hypothetical protein